MLVIIHSLKRLANMKHIGNWLSWLEKDAVNNMAKGCDPRAEARATEIQQGAPLV